MSEKYTYIGRRVGKGRREYHYQDEAGKTWILRKSLLSNLPLGAIVEINFGDKGGIKLSPPEQAPRYVGVMEPKAEWLVQDRLAETELAALARKRKDAKNSVDFGDLTLRQLRQELMKSTSSIGRNGILASVVGYLTSTRVSMDE